MARKNDTEQANTEQTAGAATTATPADDRFKKVTTPSGRELNRKDYILELWTGAVTSDNAEGKKWSRGQIAKHLSEITGKAVKYQIVFATTKGKAGGPDKPAEAAAAPAEGAAA